MELSALPLSYDAAGNLAADGQKSLTYNSQNKLIEANSPLGTGQYVYKDSGSRLQKKFALAKNPGQTTELINPTRLITLQKKPGASRGAVQHIYLNGVRLAALGPHAVGNTAIRYYHTDQVSSVKLTTDGKADVVQRQEYRPYGGAFLATGYSPWLENPKFNSQEHDKESGLDFFNARHYDANLAHFISADTTIDGENKAAGWNRYMFTHGNPVKYADPSGRGHLYILAHTTGTSRLYMIFFPKKGGGIYYMPKRNGFETAPVAYVGNLDMQYRSADKHFYIELDDDAFHASPPPAQWGDTKKRTGQYRILNFLQEKPVELELNFLVSTQVPESFDHALAAYQKKNPTAYDLGKIDIAAFINEKFVSDFASGALSVPATSREAKVPATELWRSNADEKPSDTIVNFSPPGASTEAKSKIPGKRAEPDSPRQPRGYMENMIIDPDGHVFLDIEEYFSSN